SRLESQLSAAERQITQKGIEAGVSLETRLEVKLEGAASDLRATYDELIQTIGPADLTQRGKLFYLTQEYSNAAGVLTTSLEQKYDECLDISKHDNSSVLGKGLVLARQGKYREAIDLYKRELDYSRDSNYLLYKAGAHWMIGEREQAWANLNDAKITNPRDCK